MKKTIHQLFDEFLYEAEFVKKVRPETLRGYRTTYTTFINFSPGVSLYNISAETITQFFRTLEERKRIVGKGIIRSGIKKSTVATYRGKLNVFFQWLSSRGYIKSNPFTGMKFSNPSYENREYLQKEQIEKIVTAIHINQSEKILLFKRNLVLFYLLLFCGLRREELLLLKVRNIDFERKVVTIEGETSKSRRTRQVPLHSTTIMHLKDYLLERKQFTTPYLIVSSKRDDQLTGNGLKHLVANLRKLSGIPFHLHQFRHTFAVNFLKTTNNIFKLKLILGHKDIRVTMLYLRYLPVDELRGDIEALRIDTLL